MSKDKQLGAPLLLPIRAVGKHFSQNLNLPKNISKTNTETRNSKRRAAPFAQQPASETVSRKGMSRGEYQPQGLKLRLFVIHCVSIGTAGFIVCPPIRRSGRIYS
jgi:hypothetical protein